MVKALFQKPFQVGDLVVYRKTKHSLHPGPRAEDIIPASSGDDYSYCVDKYWVVSGQASENEIIVRTRRGKTHILKSNDPNLRRANLWERWFLGNRFPSQDDVENQ
ncbi:MAG: hypothetical protein Tsb009_34250 [Planctomycetaceae bacterium]